MRVRGLGSPGLSSCSFCRNSWGRRISMGRESLLLRSCGGRWDGNIMLTPEGPCLSFCIYPSQAMTSSSQLPEGRIFVNLQRLLCDL